MRVDTFDDGTDGLWAHGNLTIECRFDCVSIEGLKIKIQCTAQDFDTEPLIRRLHSVGHRVGLTSHESLNKNS